MKFGFHWLGGFWKRHLDDGPIDKGWMTEPAYTISSPMSLF